MNRRLYQIILLIVVIGFTILFAKQFNGHINKFIPHIDKVVHFTIFFVLAGIMNHAFKAPIWLHILLLTGYGVAIEIMQQYLPHRQASIADVIADSAGAICYFSLYWFKLKRNK